MEKYLKLRLNILPSDYNKFTNKITNITRFIDNFDLDKKNIAILARKAELKAK